MNGFENTAKLLIVLGLTIIIIGTVLLASAKLGWGLFRLPGDIVIKKGNFTFYFPWVTCLVLSIILTIILGILA